MGKGRRPWRLMRMEYGYLPHFQKVGRVMMEVRFLPCPRDKYDCWLVLNLTTGETGHFRKNGTPLNNTRGRLVGPLVTPRRVIR